MDNMKYWWWWWWWWPMIRMWTSLVRFVVTLVVVVVALHGRDNKLTEITLKLRKRNLSSKKKKKRMKGWIRIKDVRECVWHIWWWPNEPCPTICWMHSNFYLHRCICFFTLQMLQFTCNIKSKLLVFFY